MTLLLLTILLRSAVLFAIEPAAMKTAVETTPTFQRVYSLKPDEGVFAYSRISPDGRYITYGSQPLRGSRPADWRETTIKVVDLASKKLLFSENGMDGYFSTDGGRMIYLSMKGRFSVSIWHLATGKATRDIARQGLGDYYSWATRDGRDLILTIDGNYYNLRKDKAQKHATVRPCPGIGAAQRPLISRDGMRISTFSRGTVVIRNLSDCSFILETGIPGAKTDFSWDGRYVAMHAPKPAGTGYDILVVDIQERTVRNVTRSLSGNSYYPNWTRDGRLSFRYDGEDYRGFMFASNVLSSPATPLAAQPQKLPASRSWSQLFPETVQPSHKFNLVVVYGAWNAHSPLALAALQQTAANVAASSLDVGVTTAADPSSTESDINHMLATYGIELPRIPLSAERAPLTEIANQSPATLLFRDGILIGSRLGAQSPEELESWLRESGAGKSPVVRSAAGT